ncbi:sure-like protein, partial [Jaminaea rosea]
YGVNAGGYKNVKSSPRKLKIILTNDDSWESANIRATYYALRSAGHNVTIASEAHQQSGTGGTVKLPVNQTIVTPGRGDSIPASAPYFGRNETDPAITYFDGTPTAAVFWALDQVKYFGDDGPDLIVSGPNEGTNLGPFLYTLSGTIGATYAAIERGYPAMAFSSSSKARSYKTLDVDNAQDESNILGTQIANFVSAWSQQNKQGRLLPQAIGLNINFSPTTSSCPNQKPKWATTRLTGKANIDKLVVGSNNLPQYEEYATPEGTGLNKCNSGDCSLPGETEYIDGGDCRASVSIFSTDYDAPVDKT